MAPSAPLLPLPPLQQVYLVRHGETAWTLSGQLTGLTDIPLTERGEQQAEQVRARLGGLRLARVISSPLRRAWRTGELAGFADRLEPEPDLVEWNYGAYEGRRTREVREDRPAWNLFADGCPGGEDAEAVGRRADRVIARVRAEAGHVLVFAHRDVLRVVAARWLNLRPQEGRCFFLSTTSVSVLGYHHDLHEPVICLWNDADGIL